MKRTLVYILYLSIFVNTFAQEYKFFSDSPSISYYDPSYGYYSGNSRLELINTNKCPVETGIKYTGTNSLRIRWNSAAGGDWGMAVASDGWKAYDFSVMDSISFYIYAADTVKSAEVPVIYIEDKNNNKTAKQLLSNFSGDILPSRWNRISLPISVFSSASGSADMKNIKTIYLGQRTADAKEHLIYIDEISIFKTSDLVPPGIPMNVKAVGLGKHIDVSWSLNAETDVAGYRIFKFQDDAYKIIGSTDNQTNGYTDFIGVYDSSASYKVLAYDVSGNQSELSNIVSSSTAELNDEGLLDMLQLSTFRYFWDYAHPVSGLARERNGSGDVVTSGGSGFGLMCILSGIEWGFVTKEEGRDRIFKIVNFLSTKADRFHGAFPHWLNGSTGKTIAFSTYDNGGDLVETAFMIQGLLTVREYYRSENSVVSDSIVKMITGIWESVEWDWYRKDAGSSYLYWHWSPDYSWKMNMRITGFNEAMIVYLLAMASPTHSVPADCYNYGWAGGSSYANGSSYYGYPMYVGYAYGGPLFFAHYSFLGFDPRFIKDKYANYFERNKSHTLINRAYCANNPKKFSGYSENIWGLTASDDPYGYSAHEPFGPDNGTITPSAALSSMPYTPKESIAAFKEMYSLYGKNIWGYMGFKDAFNIQQNWYAGSYLAIDQGPIMIMAENYRSGLLWNTFMKNPEFLQALKLAGFSKDSTTSVADNDIIPEKFELLGNYPNPFNPSTKIVFSIPVESNIKIEIFDILGRKISSLFDGRLKAGKHEAVWNGRNAVSEPVSSGVYLYRISMDNKIMTAKMMLQK